jgi:hypothetical protein
LTYVSSVGTQSIRQKEEELGFLEQCCEQWNYWYAFKNWGDIPIFKF